jgi:DNA-binding beta-propeller fold protein YncE
VAHIQIIIPQSLFGVEHRGWVALSLIVLLNLEQSARGEVLVGSNRTDSVLRFDECSGALLGEFITAGLGGLSRPGGLAVGPDGNVYVSSNGTNAVLRYDGRTGGFIDVFATGGKLTKPSALIFGPDGNLYVNSQGTSPYCGTTARQASSSTCLPRAIRVIRTT